MKEEALRMDRVTLTEQGIRLLDNFNFQIFKGEVMGLISLDSHGLDTLLTLLCENRPLYFGYVYLGEKLVNSYAAAIHSDNNVFVIMHEEALVRQLSIAENIFILRSGYRGHFISRRQIRTQLEIQLKELGIDTAFHGPISKMSRCELYISEILKAVIARSELIVLYDPFSLLDSNDMQLLYHVIRHYAAEGQAFLYIGTREEDLLQICDRISVMKDGHIVQICSTDSRGQELITHYLSASKNRDTSLRLPVSGPESRPVIFRCTDLMHGSFGPFSFDIREGEFLIITSDDRTFGDHLTMGLTMEDGCSGEILIRGRKQNRRNLHEIAVILENPAESMLFGHMSYEDNLTISLGRRIPEIWGNRQTRLGIAREIFGEELPDLSLPVHQLSMLQKYQLVYTRVRLQQPSVIFCILPYLNVNLVIRDYIYRQLKAFRDEGTAVVVISVNPDNLQELADRRLHL